ncbi:MAG: neutral/alkaline non-lysosomal ceramidase N-terminal domain-containing protein [Acidimicrobiales bacterium]
MLVGTATADITPAVGAAMGGYAARTGSARGVASALSCRAVVLDDGATAVGLVVCDLLFVTRDMSDLARRLVGEAIGWRPEQLMVTATHTHSGPADLTFAQDRHYVTRVAGQIAGAVRVAFEGRVEATLKYAESPVSSVSQNRRHPDGPTEGLARILVAEPVDGSSEGQILATLVNYACHATILEHDNLQYSPDFPGAVVEVVEHVVGGRAVYLQGCAGDINPLWMRHDLAEVRRIGSIVGTAAARAVCEAQPLGSGQWAINLSWFEDTEKEAVGGRAVAGGPVRIASPTVALARRSRAPVEGLESDLRQVEVELEAAGADVDRRRALSARLATLQMEVFFARRPDPYAGRDGRQPGPGSGLEAVEVQVLRLDEQTAVVGLPGEPFVDIAAAIRRRAGLANLIVAGYANQAVGYLPVASAFPEGGYEVGCARFEPDAAERLVDAAVGALAATSEGGGYSLPAS